MSKRNFDRPLQIEGVLVEAPKVKLARFSMFGKATNQAQPTADSLVVSPESAY
jgi:hypothetical protein